MKMKTVAVALATASAGSLALVGPATAATTIYGHYSQTTSNLQCSGTGQVLGGKSGGTLSVKVSGQETRPSDQHFRMDHLKTRIVAQEKTYNGTWKSVAWGPWAAGGPGPIQSDGATNVAPFVWGGATNPTLSVNVKGFDDLFRARVVSRLFDDEGVKIATLVTRQGQCRL